MTMFCNQCEETAQGIACTQRGVCGKTAATAQLQDEIIAALINLASFKPQTTQEEDDLITEGLFLTLTNVNFDDEALAAHLKALESLVPQTGRSFTAAQLWQGPEDVRSLRTTLLLGLKGVAAYYHHAKVLGYKDQAISDWLRQALAALGQEHTVAEWLELLLACGKINYQTMALLDKANTATYGNPIPTEVPFKIEAGPFIVVTGHDLKDLAQILEQTQGRGVKIYTHSDLLPAHGYPQLKKYPHFKGNFGTTWCNQRQEFDNIPAPILYTPNCIKNPKKSYLDQIFTTSVVGYPRTRHIATKADGSKDFAPIIAKALELGGYPTDQLKTGLNGGATATTGYGRQTVLDVADQVVDAVQKGAIKHFFLVGGCDGHANTRQYYTEFVRQTPADSLILTLACGKFRFNDLDLGKIGPFPRLLDMGQCNDAYGAIQVALALAEAFNRGVNELPLTLVLSWYEQKAVAIVLTLLSLGVKNIYVGPTVPAFFSPQVLKILVDQFGITPVSQPQEDLAKMLK